MENPESAKHLWLKAGFTWKWWEMRWVKLPGHRQGLPGKVISFYILPLDPAYKAELAGHVPVTGKATYHLRCRATLYLTWHRTRGRYGSDRG